MNLQRFLPAISLQPYIREFILIETEDVTDSTVIPDTSLVMSLQYRGQVVKKLSDGKDTLPGIVVSGLRKSVRHFVYTKQTANFLVVFREGRISAFSRMPANELFDLSISADNLFPRPDLDQLLELLAEATTDLERVRKVESFLLAHLANAKQDALIIDAVKLIHRYNGIVRIGNLAGALHISQDPFEKRFRTQVGSTPKQYASIVRLKNLINNYPTYSSLTEASYEAGYFDQSHFIKDFRVFAGRSPKEFFQSTRFW